MKRYLEALQAEKTMFVSQRDHQDRHENDYLLQGHEDQEFVSHET